MERNQKLKYTLVAIAIIGMLTTMAYLPIMEVKQTQAPVFEDQTRGWQALADYNPGAGKGGFQRIIVKALPSGSSTNPNTNASMLVNISDISADDFYKEVPHSTKFGVYIYARFNATQAYVVGNTTWVQAYTRCRITSADLNIAADTVCNKTLVVAAGTTMLYMCFYLELNASAKPLLLNRDSTFSISSIKLEAYY
jgi:hypothetical protein